jgi:hypothetical protein
VTVVAWARVGMNSDDGRGRLDSNEGVVGSTVRAPQQRKRSMRRLRGFQH